MRLHVDFEPHLRESYQSETWGERVGGSRLLPSRQRQADRTLWRARPPARRLRHSHWSVWPVEAIERRSRCCCQGGQHPYHLGDADWHRAAVPLLPVAAAHRQPVCAAAPWGWVRWVCGELFAILFLWGEVNGLKLILPAHFPQTGCAKLAKASQSAEFLEKKVDWLNHWPCQLGGAVELWCAVVRVNVFPAFCGSVDFTLNFLSSRPWPCTQQSCMDFDLEVALDRPRFFRFDTRKSYSCLSWYDLTPDNLGVANWWYWMIVKRTKKAVDGLVFSHQPLFIWQTKAPLRLIRPDLKPSVPTEEQVGRYLSILTCENAEAGSGLAIESRINAVGEGSLDSAVTFFPVAQPLQILRESARLAKSTSLL